MNNRKAAEKMADEIVEELDKHLQTATGYILGAGFEPYLISKLQTVRAERDEELVAAARETGQKHERLINATKEVAHIKKYNAQETYLVDLDIALNELIDALAEEE